jgi:hypothetical protein
MPEKAYAVSKGGDIWETKAIQSVRPKRKKAHSRRKNNV